MLKIKDNVDLKELEKFGYLEGKYMLCCSYNAYGKIYYEQLDNILKVDIEKAVYVVEIDKHNKKIELHVTTTTSPRSFCYDHEDIVRPYIKELIEADLVEEVEDCEWRITF